MSFAFVACWWSVQFNTPSCSFFILLKAKLKWKFSLPSKIWCPQTHHLSFLDFVCVNGKIWLGVDVCKICIARVYYFRRWHTHFHINIWEPYSSFCKLRDLSTKGKRFRDLIVIFVLLRCASALHYSWTRLFIYQISKMHTAIACCPLFTCMTIHINKNRTFIFWRKIINLYALTDMLSILTLSYNTLNSFVQLARSMCNIGQVIYSI